MFTKNYAMIANPKAGNLTPDEKAYVLRDAQKILGCGEIFGLETESAEEFRECARELANEFTTVVAVGGDGTASEVYNAIAGHDTQFGFLAMGSGTALRDQTKQGSFIEYQLAPGRVLRRAAQRIAKDLPPHDVDLILCHYTNAEGKPQAQRALLASVGIEGHVLRESERLRAQGKNSFASYIAGTTRSLFGKDKYKQGSGRISYDGEETEVRNLATIVVSKHPYYGCGLNVNPRAVMDDGNLHTLQIEGGASTMLAALAASLFSKNPLGKYQATQTLGITLEGEMCLQLDGDFRAVGREFYFEVMPAELKFVY